MILENALAHYYPQVQRALHELFRSEPDPKEFTPGIELPQLDAAMRDYLSASALAHVQMGSYRGRTLSLLDLTRNPATMTTKTFASLVIVARAIRFIQDTGQRVTLLTPSSANKAIALRDAVLRAITTGLVSADQLNIVTIVPTGSVSKLRGSKLSDDADLRARNPLAVYGGANPGAVKAIARAVVDEFRDLVEAGAKTNLWYTLQLENYLSADVVRAFAENDYFPPHPGLRQRRLHVHAVSSAYGLLGHACGREMLGQSAAGLPPGYFLVQHLGAPDMVLSLYHHVFGGDSSPPAYAFDADTGSYHQDANPHFPAVTLDTREVLDPTFYTRNPPTSARMNALIAAQGGGGIVVSLAECLQRYGQVRFLLAEGGVSIPANPTLVQEWSLVMAVTGILNAIDRALASEEDIVVHGSGIYCRNDLNTMPTQQLVPIHDGGALRDLVLQASAP